MCGKYGDVRPVVARACGREDLACRGQVGDEVCVPAAHFAARIPKRAEDGVEGAPAVFFQGGDEGGAVSFFQGRLDDCEFLREGGVEIRVIFNGIADVEDCELHGV